MAYAAVISLKYTIHYLNKPQITTSAYQDLESVGSVLKRLDGSSNRGIDRSAISALDAEIREAVCKLEDALRFYYLLCGCQGGDENAYGLQQEIDSFSKTVKKLKEEYSEVLDNPLPVEEEDEDEDEEDFGGNKSTTVGLCDQLEQIRTELLDSVPGSKVVSLVGMAGIGKTHLATEIYHHPHIGEGFDFKVWLRVGPQQQVKNVWAEMVALVEGGRRQVYMEENIIKLVEILETSLRGRGRCLIVLDDIWSARVCDSLIRLLGGDGNGRRRLLLTTRLEEVARYHSTSIHHIRFFNIEESWKLLQLNVFGDEYFPPQLETAGRKIAENCEGLPLLILAIADILSGLQKTEEYWNAVADSKTSTFTDAYDRIEKVLFSSYEYLPQFLKACFLYMGVFPQKSEIPLPKLINLWIVEDVLESQPSLIRTRKRVALSEPKPSNTRASRQMRSIARKKRISVNPILSGTRSLIEDHAFMKLEWNATRLARTSENIAFTEPKRVAVMDLMRSPTSENVALLEPKPSETTSASTAENDAFMELPRYPTRAARTSENVAFMEPERIETCPQLSSERSCFKTCRYEPMRPLESLYLLEPGPSPIRYIKPLDKRDHFWFWEPRQRSLTRTPNPPRFMDTSAPKIKTTPKGIAMECLKKVVSNSLTIVCKQSSNNKIKSCKLHSAYWHLCVKEARKNKFFHVLKKLTDASGDDIGNQRRLSVQTNMLFGIKEVYDSMAATSTARSLLCTGPDQEYPVPICLNLMLLKVLDALAIRLYDFPADVVKLLELRYLALTHNGKLPPSISKLQELQYLIVRQHHSIEFLRDSTRLPKDMRNEIRDMQQMWSTNLLGDSTCSAKDIWEKICDVQQVWSSSLQGDSTCFTKEMWMHIWKLIWDMQPGRTAALTSNTNYSAEVVAKEMQQLWSTKLVRDLTCFPEEIWVDIWEKMWDMQLVWSTKLQRDSISLLKEIWEEIWDMQQVRSTKLLSDSTFFPKEIWDMQELRLLRIKGRNLPDPSYDTELPNLSTLHVNAHSCTYNVFRSIPSLQKLGIKIELQPDSAETLSCFKYIKLLNQLKSLKCVVVNPRLRSQVVAPPQHLSNLPSSLKKLSLNGLGYRWECMSMIGSLPKLQVLKLRCCAFQGPEWETGVKEFPMLKYLLLEDMDVVKWRVDEDLCFPSLHHLIIRHCYRLKNLPGYITALKTIHLLDCSPLVVASAQQTQQDRHPSLQVVITSSWTLRR